jgi:Leucine-rich repeat (LRR) protein
MKNNKFALNNLKSLDTINDNDNDLIFVIMLNNQNIDKVPHKIIYFNNLTTLCLDQNFITQIPDFICEMTNLKFLSLHNNLLTELPQSIGNLTKLEKLYLGFNRIKYIPSTMANLNCEEISLDNNELCGLPLALAKTQTKFSLSESSYENLNNLDPDCEFIIIDYLSTPLLNLPINLQILKLYNPVIEISNVKIPFGCEFYVDGKKIN